MARVLYLTTRLPYPPHEGHQLRAWHLLRAVARAHEVELLSLRRADEPEPAPELRALVRRVETVPIPAERSRVALMKALATSVVRGEPLVAHKYVPAELARRFATRVREADLVHFGLLPLAALRAIVPAGVPVVLDEHNVEWKLAQARVPLESRRLVRGVLAREVGPLRRFEATAVASADRVLACSEVDAAQLRELAPGARVSVIPNGVDVEALRPAPVRASASELLFVGGMGWFPNRDGVAWFLAEILPRVLAQRPQVRFTLVGNAQGLEVPPAVRGAVRLAGFVPDLVGAYHAAGAAIVPLRAGSGTRLKVLEAMAFGLPMVSTHVGAEGIALAHERDVLHADDAEGFAAAILRLVDDPELGDRLGRAARALAEREYGWHAIGRRLVAVYEPLLARRAGDSRASIGVAPLRAARHR